MSRGTAPKRSTRHALMLLLAAVAPAGTVAPADWPNFRGPGFSAVVEDAGIQVRWSSRPPVLWKRDLGSGFSSFACVGDRVYTAGTRDGHQVLYALDATRGDEIWSTRIEPAYRERQGGDGPRATPTVSGERVYMMGARGTVLCVDLAGNKVWDRTFSGVPEWGFSGSVLVEGDLAVVAAGGAAGGLVALDRETGATRGSTAGGRGPAGYATPYPFTIDGTRYIAGFLGREAIVVEAATGKEFWKLRWRTSYDVNAATPIFDGGRLFLSSGYHHGAALYKLRKADGGLEGKLIWENESIRAKFQTPVLHDGFLYASDERGLKCVEFATGRVAWSIPRLRHGTLIIAVGTILFVTERGELQMAPASPRGFRPRFKAAYFSSRCWTAPALREGLLYMRDLEGMVCVDLRRKP